MSNKKQIIGYILIKEYPFSKKVGEFINVSESELLNKYPEYWKPLTEYTEGKVEFQINQEPVYRLDSEKEHNLKRHEDLKGYIAWLINKGTEVPVEIWSEYNRIFEEYIAKKPI